MKPAVEPVDLTNLSLKQLMHEVKMRGARFNNLFHRMDGQWQCNLRTRDAMMFFEFGYGPDAETAIIAALRKLEQKKFVPPASGPAPDDERDPRQIGTCKEATNPIPEYEVTPAFRQPVAVTPPALDADELDDLLGGPAVVTPAVAAIAADDIDDLLG